MSAGLDLNLFINRLVEPGRIYPYLLDAGELGRESGVFPPLFEHSLERKRLENAWLGVASPLEQQALGENLFHAVFSGPSNRLLQQVWGAALNEKKRINLNICCQDAQAGSYPWELLFDAQAAGGRGAFICQSPWVNLVHRYTFQASGVRNSRAELPRRVLLAWAEPREQRALDHEAEVSAIRRWMDPYVKKGLIDLVVLEHAGQESLFRELRDHPPFLFHFIGHAWEDKALRMFLLLEGAQGKAQPVYPQSLMAMLGQSVPAMVFLNACATGYASARQWSLAEVFIQAGVQRVFANLTRILDVQAADYAVQVYQKMLDGLSAEQALIEARSALLACYPPATSQWYAPRLYVNGPETVNAFAASSTGMAQVVQKMSIGWAFIRGQRAASSRSEEAQARQPAWSLDALFRVLGVADVEIHIRANRGLGAAAELVSPHSTAIAGGQDLPLIWRLGRELAHSANVSWSKARADQAANLVVKAVARVFQADSPAWSSAPEIVRCADLADPDLGDVNRQFILPFGILEPGAYRWELRIEYPLIDLRGAAYTNGLLLSSALRILSPLEIEQYQQLCQALPADLPLAERDLLLGSLAESFGLYEQALLYYQAAQREAQFTRRAVYCAWRVWANRAYGVLSPGGERLLRQPVEDFAKRANDLLAETAGTD